VAWDIALSFTYAFTTSFQQNAPLLAAIGRRRCERTSLRCETPLLHVCFYENESHLAEVDVNISRAICANRGEEVLALKAVCDVLESFAVAGEENSTGPRAIAYAYYVALYESWRIVCCVERLVVSSLSSRCICDRVFVKSRKSEKRVGFCCKSNTE
jgi:hypothetical protein